LRFDGRARASSAGNRLVWRGSRDAFTASSQPGRACDTLAQGFCETLGRSAPPRGFAKKAPRPVGSLGAAAISPVAARIGRATPDSGKRGGQEVSMSRFRFVSQWLRDSGRRGGTPPRRPVRPRLALQALDERSLPSSTFVQTNLVSDQ